MMTHNIYHASENFSPFTSQSMSGISFGSDIDVISPDDSSSRRGVLSENNNAGDSNISTPAPSTTKPSSSTKLGPWEQSNLIFVKDDKYESNIDYLEGLMGVFQSAL